ncbi:hypothetical protein GQ55_9G399300 [Panicum hallii var. hallii]|uniref:RRM domain-containing protein n=1 Tax=Panicum hallii var. hallii TaxID=1504633 RepID=A0A2T7C9V6_9POAL|nr:hypothetical protein GQ55_9G399300 [Panicum hallii var. hallii]
MVRVWEVLDANETARSAYLRILSRPTRREVAQNAICLLLWLETTMGFDILRSVAAMVPDDISLARIVFEANALCTYVLHGYYAMPPPFEGFPAITALCGGGRLIDHRFFRFHKDLVARGVTMIRDTVAALVFNDILHAMLRRLEDDSNSLLIPNPVPAPELMAPFIISTTTPPEDSQTVFVAFPEYHPLSSQDIKDYFERTLGFGHCIERIATERPCTRQSAKHGVVVFRSAELRDEAMHGEAAVFFRVDGRDMWVQPYMPPY